MPKTDERQTTTQSKNKNPTLARTAVSGELHMNHSVTVLMTWTRGGDCEILETENAVNQAVKYVLEGQD